MREIGERSGGVWRPSPGSIYPTLQQLEDEELVRPETGDSGRRVFALTDTGRETQSAAGDAPAPWDEVGVEGDNTALELRDLVGQVMAAARQVLHAGESAQIAQAKDVLRDTRRKLYRILAEDSPEASEPEAE
jgi:DNA-binding PadR family transcriptional regulator